MTFLFKSQEMSLASVEERTSLPAGPSSAWYRCIRYWYSTAVFETIEQFFICIDNEFTLELGLNGMAHWRNGNRHDTPGSERRLNLWKNKRWKIRLTFSIPEKAWVSGKFHPRRCFWTLRDQPGTGSSGSAGGEQKLTGAATRYSLSAALPLWLWFYSE